MNTPGYTQIRRGPMGGDHYTQIHNWVFRDRTLTPNAKAIFGWISTHTQGWGTSIEGIAEAVDIGRDAARAALVLLKDRHYLVHGRERSKSGTLGAGWYFLTDLPAQLAEAGITDDALIERKVTEALHSWEEENRSSEPGWRIQYPGDTGESSQVETRMAKTRNLVQPRVAVGPPKKTKEPQEHQGQEFPRSKEHIAPSSPATHGVAGHVDTEAESEADDRGADVAPSKAGVKPGTRRDEDGSHDVGTSATSPAVGDQSSALDDLGSGASQREREMYEATAGWPKLERLYDLIDGLVGGLEEVRVDEPSKVWAMLEREVPYQRIVNTVLQIRGEAA